MNKTVIFVVGILCSIATFASPFDSVRLIGRTNKSPVSYKVNEKIDFAITLKGLEKLPPGEWSVGWQLRGDDGQSSKGVSPIQIGKPLHLTTQLKSPGFIRLEAYLLDASGKRVRRDVAAPGENWTGDKEVFFDGGAGAEIEKITTQATEPADFDDFWARQKSALKKVPLKATRTEVKSPNPQVRLYAVQIDCAGGRPATGYLSIPVACEKGKRVPAKVSFDGYGTPIQKAPRAIWNTGAIDFHVNAHGYDLGKDASYYKDFFTGIKSNGKPYAFDSEQNSDPETAYFHGMALRVMRAIEYIASLPEWNRTRLEVEGGSQGGLQSVWAAALCPQVTHANVGFIWCCDIGKSGETRLKSNFEPASTPALRYYDAVNHAKRIHCPVKIPRAGLGDDVCPPSGLALFYANLATKAESKSIEWVQGSRHGYVPPKEDRADYKPLAEEPELSAPKGPSTARDLVTNSPLEKNLQKGEADELGGKPGILMKDTKGNHFIRLTQKKSGSMPSIYRKHDVTGGYNRLAVSLKARITGLIIGAEKWHDARLIFNFKDKSGKIVKTDCVNFSKDTPDWVDAEKVVSIPESAATLEYMICLFNCQAGTFDFDNIRLTLLKPNDAVPGKRAYKVLPPKKYADPERPPLGAADELRVKGNRLVNQKGEEVWLQGLAIPSLEWLSEGDHIKSSFEAAVCDWNVNVIRLALYSGFWFGRGKSGKMIANDGGKAYRKLVDELVDYANAHGVYVALDLHEYRAPQPHHAEFWRDAAKRYANRPGVLFDILNEPYDISWREWRDGGTLKDGGGKAAVETLDGKGLTSSIGMQKLVEEVRSTGARNVIIAGGLDWSYDCTGIMNGYALEDKAGNGIMYSVHVYPWKKGWQKAFLDCAAKYPLFLGEVGCMNRKMPFETELKDPYAWAPKILACIQAYRLNWTAWSFHTNAAPCVISDWDYTPTPAWGAFVRAALYGAKFVSDQKL